MIRWGRWWSTKTSSFVIASTAQTGYGLQGTLHAQPKAVRLGETLMLAGAVINRGNADVQTLPVKLYLIDPALGVVIKTYSYTLDAAQSATVAVDAKWPAQGEVGKTYLAVLTATTGVGTAEKTLTLAEDSFTLQPQIAASIKATGGTPQSRTNGKAYAAALEVTVLNTIGEPISGVVVTFTAPTAATGVASGRFNNGLSTQTATTDVSGKASVAIEAGGVAGAFVVTAQASGVSQIATFNLQNIERITFSMVALSGTPQSTTITKPFSDPLQIQIKNSLGQVRARRCRHI